MIRVQTIEMNNALGPIMSMLAKKANIRKAKLGTRIFVDFM
jgi:hypothetical protein